MNISTTTTMERNQFYENLFTSEREWSQPFPNYDEATRAAKIMPIVSLVAQEYYARQGGMLRIIDVGCGRGWLTNLLSTFGDAVGLEPVPKVVEYAEKLFPNLHFLVGDPEQQVKACDHETYDVVVCSEVIEHIPVDAQSGFLKALGLLVRPGGDIIITTPRGELFPVWARSARNQQPVEAWLTEDQLDRLVRDCGLLMIERNRCREIRVSERSPNILHRRPLRTILSSIGLVPDTSSRLIYQVVWLRRPTEE